FLRGLPLEDFGVEWVQPPACLAHPLDDGRVAVLERSIAATGESLGADAAAWRRLVAPFVARWDALPSDVLGPPHRPRHPLLMTRFGLRGLRSARGLAQGAFRDPAGRALVAGLGAHAILPLDQPPTGAAAIVLGALAHAAGWAIPRGGSQTLADALGAYLR